MRTVVGRILLAMFLLVLVATVVVAVTLYSSNISKKATAAQMMGDAARLEVGSDLAVVRAFADKYSGHLSASWQENPCTQSDCLAIAAVSSDMFGKNHSKLDAIHQIFMNRWWSYSVFVWVKNGRVTAKQQWFAYATRKRALAVIAEMSDGSAELCEIPSYRLHRTFTVGMAPHHFNIWIAPGATEESALWQLNLDCASNVRGCRSVSEMAPNAWQQYESEKSAIETLSVKEAKGTIADCKERWNTR